MSKKDKYASSYLPANQRRRHEGIVKEMRFANGSFRESYSPLSGLYESWIVFDELEDVLLQKAQPDRAGVPALVKRLRNRLRQVQEREQMQNTYGGVW